MITTYQDDQLKITREQIDYMLRSSTSEAFPVAASRDGNDRLMVVGFDQTGNLIEVGVEYISDNQEHIFHAMPATKQWRAAYDKGRTGHDY